MRSIICISVAIGLAMPAWAEAPLGCFTRTYSDAHLAKNPDQIVRSMQLRIHRDPNFGDVIADLGVEFANQGRVKGTKSAGAFMDQILICWDDGGRFGCSVECDGGWFTVSRQTSDSITIATDGLWVGDVEGCGGAETIEEIAGQTVKYKLLASDIAACVWD